MECLGSDHGWEPETQQRPAVRRWPAHGGPRTAPTELFGEARNRRTLTVDDQFPAESDPQGPLCARRERQDVSVKHLPAAGGTHGLPEPARPATGIVDGSPRTSGCRRCQRTAATGRQEATPLRQTAGRLYAIG